MPITFETIVNEFYDHTPFYPSADVGTYRDFVRRQYGAALNVPEQVKSNARAAVLRQQGNLLYRADKTEDALYKYNESICFAEAGSEELAMGYANRSAIYSRQGDEEYALYNIALAKQNHYPERLMPKLLAREQKCRESIDESKKTAPVTHLQVVKEPNPRIPFLAKGITMKVLPGFGRGLVAEKSFEAGDLVLSEKFQLACVDYSLRHQRCGGCSKEFEYSLIPCPNCVFLMYCSEECLERDWKFAHRFQCGIATKLAAMTMSTCAFGAKFFLYGLSLFNDDLQEMMKRVPKPRSAGGNVMALDYVNYDRMEEFLALHKGKVEYPSQMKLVFKLVAATMYNIYMMNPLVSAIVATKTQRDFLLRYVHYYTESCDLIAVCSNLGRLAALCPFISLVNHSCDPNARSVVHSGRAQVMLLRPVRTGEQICFAQGPVWWKPHAPCDPLEFRCACVVCKMGKINWSRVTKKQLPSGMKEEGKAVEFLFYSTDQDQVHKMNSLKEYIQRYAYVHPEPFFAGALSLLESQLEWLSMEEIDKIESFEVASKIFAGQEAANSKDE